MTHEAIAQQEAAATQAQQHILAIAASLEAQVQTQPDLQKPHQNDSISGTPKLATIESPANRQLDPLASLPRPILPLHPPATRAYTIWQAISAVSELFEPQSIANSDILAVMNKVSALVQNNVNKVTKYQTAVADIREHIQHVVSSEKWMNWGLAVLGIAFGAAVGFAIGGPMGLAIALAVGTSVLMLSNQINVGGQPLGNWLVKTVSGGKIRPGDTSGFGAVDKQVYDLLSKWHALKGQVGKELIEGFTQICLGLAVGLVTSAYVAEAVTTAAAVDELSGEGDAAVSDTLQSAVLDDQDSDDEEIVDVDSDSEDDGDRLLTRRQQRAQQDTVAVEQMTSASNDSTVTAPAQQVTQSTTPGSGVQQPVNGGHTAQAPANTTTPNDTSTPNQQQEQQADDIQGAGTASPQPGSTPEEIEESDSEVEELVQLERRAQQEQDQLEAVDRRNPGGVGKNEANPRLRGLVLGLTQGNQIAQADTENGDAYADVVEAMGASKEVAGWVGFAFGELVNLAASIGGLWLGSAPGDSNQMLMTAMRYIAYVQPVVTTITAAANSLVDYNLWRLTSDLEPQKKNLDHAEADVQLIQQGEKVILGMASTTTNMITKEMESAVAILNEARQVVQSMFEA